MMTEWRKQALAAATAGDYDVAIDITEAHPDLCPSDLLLMGRCIQLSNGDVGRQPDDAAAVFRRALTLDPDFVPAMIELGWMYFSVFDDPREGKQYFERAIEVTRRNAIDAFRGAARCAEEISGREGRAEVMRRASELVKGDDLEDASTPAP